MKHPFYHTLANVSLFLLLYVLTTTAAAQAASSVVAWGDNSTGQTNVPPDLAHVVAVAGGSGHSLALLSNGTVMAWGRNEEDQGVVPGALSNVVSIAAGYYHNIALRSDGTVNVWGRSYVVGTMPPFLASVGAVAAGGYYSTAAVKTDGTFVGWGNFHSPTGLTDVVALAVGWDHTLALRSDGKVVAAGYNSSGQCNVPPGLSHVVAVAAGGYHSLALRDDGTVVAWGSNGSGQTNVPAGLKPVVAVAAGNSHSLALQYDGTIVAWGADSLGQCDVPQELTNVVAIAAGANHGLAVVSDEPAFLRVFPKSVVTYSGKDLVLRALAGGAPVLAYRWQQNNTDLPGATNAFLRLPNLHAGEGGTFTAVVSNRLGEVLTDIATVTVEDSPPLILGQPGDQIAHLRNTATVTFFVGADGSAPLTYQWRVNGTNISGATSNSTTASITGLDQSGEYTVVVANSFGSVTSAPARLLVVGPGPLDQWSWRSPEPQGEDLRSIAYGNGRFVAVGDDGNVVMSTDGVNWTNQVLPAYRLELRCIAFGNGVFVTVGYGELTANGPWEARAFASADGLIWTRVSMGLGTGIYAYGVTFGDGLFVASTSSGVILSSDGLQWERPASAGPSYAHLTYGDGKFLAAYSDRVYSSEDGRSWSTRATLTNSLACIGYGNSLFLAGSATWQCSTQCWTASRVWISSNLTTWTSSDLAGWGQIEGLAADAGRFVAVGSTYPDDAGWIRTSLDGVTWEDHYLAVSNAMYAVAYGGGLFVAVGEFGNIFTSPDGLAWTPRSRGTSNNYRDLVCGDGLYVAVGNGGRVATSPDGRHWAVQPPPTTNNLRAVAWGAGMFVAVGGEGVIFSSSDGVQWDPRNSHTTAGLFGVGHGGGRFVAAGDKGKILTSLDGVNWVEGDVGSMRLQGVAHDGGQFVVTGQEGLIFTSPDGFAWTRQGTETTEYLQAIAYGSGLFVAVGNEIIAVSTNGRDWSITRPLGPELEGVAYGNGTFMIVGSSGTILTSTDGQVWISRDHPTRETLRDVTFAGSLFTIVGNNDFILQSETMLPQLAGRMLSSGFELTLRSEPDRILSLEASTDLKMWDVLATLTNLQPVSVWLDEEAATNSFRFYRAVTP